MVENYRDNELFERWRICYIPTHRDGYFLKKISTLCLALFQLFRLLLSQDILLVHVHTSSQRSFYRKSLFFMLCRLFHVPYLIHLHGGKFPTFYREECSSFGKWLVRFVFRHAAAILLLSPAWVKAIAPFSSVAPCFVAPNPLRFADIPASARTGSTLLFSGRLKREKGTYDLLDAFVQVIGKMPAARLICCGDGQLAESRQRVEALGLSRRVAVLGWVEQDRLRQILASADIFVLPSYDEGLPMSLLEAMAAELAVVTTPVGGIPDLIEDDVNGFLVQPGDIDGLAARLIALLTNPEQRLAVAAKARETVTQQFSTEQVLGRLEEVYRHFGLEPRRIP